MKDFKHGGHGGGFGGRGGRPNFGGNKFGGNKGFRRDDRGPVTMHQAICDECKKTCEVPFQPTAGKPVYCKACFSGKKDFAPRNDFGNNNNNNYKTPPRTDFGNDVKKVSGEEIKKQIEVLNVKIDRLAGMIEKMNVSKPTQAVEVNPITLKLRGTKEKVAKITKTKKLKS